MNWEDFRIRAPADEGLQRMLRDIGIKGTVKRTIRLRGGMGAATHAVEVASTDGESLRLVLKTYDPVDSEGAAREGECLQFLEGLLFPRRGPWELT